MVIRKLGVRLLGWLARLAIVALALIFLAVSLWPSSPVVGFNTDQTEVPEIPAIQQDAMSKAAETESGRKLAADGFSPRSVIDDPAQVDFLDQLLKKAKVATPGPYVVFADGQSALPAKPGEGATPDRVVDTSSGVTVALRQDYSNERGTMCFNTKTIEELGANWMTIAAGTWNMSLDLQVTVSHAQLANLPESAGDIPCYLYLITS